MPIPSPLPKFLCGLKAVVVRDGEDAEKAFPAPEVVVPDGGVILLSCRVQNVNLHLLPVQHHLLPVGIRFRGLIVFNKLQEEKEEGKKNVT